MYDKYFGLADKPFRITPDTRYMWLSPQHTEAKLKILDHIQESSGPIYLSADIGTGKTSIAKRIVEELVEDKTKEIVYVFSPKLTTTNSFLRFIMDEFEVKTHRAYGQSLRSFEEYLVKQNAEGISPVLLVDEAQNMTRDMLLLIQHLFNFSTNTSFLVQMALFAQPEFKKKLDRLPSLKSRMNVARLSPLTRDQTEEMLKFRWKVAGGESFPFNNEAVNQIYKITDGIPRSIVRLADTACLSAAINDKRMITKDIIISASSEVMD